MTNLVNSNDYTWRIYPEKMDDAHCIMEIDENNFKSIVATRDIKSGELLMIEHCLTAPMTTCMFIISHNEYFI